MTTDAYRQPMLWLPYLKPPRFALPLACLIACLSFPAQAQHLTQHGRIGHHVGVALGYAPVGLISGFPSSRMDSPEVVVGVVNRWRRLAVGGHFSYLHAGTFFNPQTSRRESGGSLFGLTAHVRWVFMARDWGGLFAAFDGGLSIWQLPSSLFGRLGGREDAPAPERAAVGVATVGSLGAMIEVSERFDGIIQLRVPWSWTVLESGTVSTSLGSVGLVVSLGLEFGLER